MKKFYEKPVVEITKFAFEDIVCASNVQGIVSSQEAAVVINQIQDSLPANTKAKNYFTYKW